MSVKDEKSNKEINEEYSDQSQEEKLSAGKEVAYRFAFYKDGYLKSLGILLTTLLTFGIISYWSFYMYSYTPPVKYIPVDAHGKVLKQIPTSQPVMSQANLKQWVFDATKKIFSYNYYNADTHGSVIRQYFSPESFKQYMKQFKNSPDLKRVKKNFFIVVVKPSMPELNMQGQLRNGRRYWRYEINLQRLFINSQGFIKDSQDLIINVVRSNSDEAKDGVLIYNIRDKVAQDKQNNNNGN